MLSLLFFEQRIDIVALDFSREVFEMTKASCLFRVSRRGFCVATAAAGFAALASFLSKSSNAAQFPKDPFSQAREEFALATVEHFDENFTVAKIHAERCLELLRFCGHYYRSNIWWSAAGSSVVLREYAFFEPDFLHNHTALLYFNEIGINYIRGTPEEEKFVADTLRMQKDSARNGGWIHHLEKSPQEKRREARSDASSWYLNVWRRERQ